MLGIRLVSILMIAIVGMGVAPVPVLRLLPLIGLLIFVGVPVVFGKVLTPGAIFVVVPVVIILVLFIVDADLDAGLLRSGCGHEGQRGGKSSGEK